MPKIRLLLEVATVSLVCFCAAVGAEVGEKAPEIRAAGFFNAKGDSPKGLADVRKAGKIALVEFWTTTCPPCRRSIPHLNELHEKYRDKGLVVFGLTPEPKQRVEKFAKAMKMAYLVGYGSDSPRDYRVRAIPQAFLVDREGKVIWAGHPMNPALEKQIAKILGSRDAG